MAAVDVIRNGLRTRWHQHPAINRRGAIGNGCLRGGELRAIHEAHGIEPAHRVRVGEGVGSAGGDVASARSRYRGRDKRGRNA